MKNFEVLCIGINCDYKKAFGYISKSENLPLWTNQFVRTKGNSATFDTFIGIVDVTFETYVNEQAGTIDWKITFPDGNSGMAYSRLTRNIVGVIYAFNFILPPLQEDDLKKAHSGQRTNIENELSKLKTLLEA